MRKTLLTALLTLAMTTLAAPAAFAEEAPKAPEIGKAAPAFELQDLEGNTHRLSDYKGKVVVLHFQSMTCPWEKAYQPHLNKIAEKYASTEQDGETVDVVFLGINANHNESVEQLKGYHSEKQMPYPILKDEGNKVADQYAAKTTPHMYVIDQDGVLRYMGGVEQVPVSVSDVMQMEQYLEPVIHAVVSGSEPPVTRTQSKGCGIKRAS